MRIKVKGRKLTTEYIWFENFDKKSQIQSKADRVVVNANRIPLIKGASLQHSLISDLTPPADSIFSSFNANVRNEIRRAERDGVAYETISSYDEAAISRFAQTYHEMYAQKGIEQALSLSTLKAYSDQGAFLLTIAKIDGEACVYHAYVVGEGSCRLLYSCSEFRAMDNATKNAIGRANRALHFHDMQYMKAHGIKTYDWGGVMSFEEPGGIDKFKMGFGGAPVDYYNSAVDLSLKAKLAAMYHKILHK